MNFHIQKKAAVFEQTGHCSFTTAYSFILQIQRKLIHGKQLLSVPDMECPSKSS